MTRHIIQLDSFLTLLVCNITKCIINLLINLKILLRCKKKFKTSSNKGGKEGKQNTDFNDTVNIVLMIKRNVKHFIFTIIVSHKTRTPRTHGCVSTLGLMIDCSCTFVHVVCDA